MFAWIQDCLQSKDALLMKAKTCYMHQNIALVHPEFCTIYDIYEQSNYVTTISIWPLKFLGLLSVGTNIFYRVIRRLFSHRHRKQNSHGSRHLTLYLLANESSFQTVSHLKFSYRS